MPGRHPGELITRVKKDQRLQKTKVVLMSALHNVRAKVGKLGADAAMKKPFTMDQFVRVAGL